MEDGKRKGGRKPICGCERKKQLYFMVEGCAIELLGGETQTKMAALDGVMAAVAKKQEERK